MKRIDRPNGVLIVPDYVEVEDVQAAPATPAAPTRRGGRLPRGPIPIAPPTALSNADDPIVRAALEQDFVLVDDFELNRAATKARRATPQPTSGEWNVAADEDAVVLLESDGVYTWRFGQEVGTTAAKRRGVNVVPGSRTIAFDLGPDVSDAPTGTAATKVRRSRSLLSDVLVGKVRGWVFKFVARFAAEKVVAALERKQRVGLVWMDGDDPLQWKPINTLREVPLPTDRTPRILLFVHGTFSSTLGSFGHLGPTAWGKSFLTTAGQRYDAVIGFDHRTLADDPLQNATQLLDRLEDSAAAALDIDAISFSRGGLVLRSLIEYLLPSARIRVRVRRAVFVAATNSGTELASPKNWNRLIDLSTNLVAAGSRAVALFAPPAALAATITNHAIGSIGAFVKALATQVLDEKNVPGLAAMVPTGSFITEINKTQPGQPTAAQSMYYAITSAFDVKSVSDNNAELPAGLVKWLADVIVDAAMRGVDNDLVVHNESTITIDPGSGAFIKDHRHFGKNPHIYHTVFFTRKEVVETIAGWFEFTAVAAAGTRGTQTPGTETRFVVVDTNKPLGEAKAQIDRIRPEYVIARRNNGEYHYAFRPEELMAALGNDTKRMSRPLEAALASTPFRFGEDSSSDEERNGKRRGPYGTRGATTHRTVVFDGAAIAGVIDSTTRSTAALGDVHVRTMSPPSAGAAMPAPTPGRRRGAAMATPATAGSEPAAPARPTRGAVKSATRGAAKRAAKKAPAPAAAAPERTNEAAAPPPPVTVYMSAETSEEIQVGKSADLSVLVSHDEIVIEAGPVRAVGKVKVATDRPLVLQVVAKKNLEVVGDSRVEVDATQPESQFIFELKGAARGDGEVWVMLRQGVQVLLTLVLKPKVVAGKPKSSTAVTRDAGNAAEASADTKEFPVLQIFESTIGKETRYHFNLIDAAGFISGYSAPLKVPQDEYVASIYQRIEDYWQSKPGDTPAFTSQLRAFGGILFDELVPAEVQQPLWDARNKLKAIQVVAEEPFIPWELVHLKEPAPQGKPRNPLPKDSHFLGQKGLVRWLHNRGKGAATVRVRKDRSRYVVPEYPGDYSLPEAQAEIPYLKKTFKSTAVSPIDANTIQALLMVPDIDHFHFSGHGEADAKNAALDAQLLLSMDKEGNTYVPRYLSSTVIGQTASLESTDGNRPLVMLNACQVGRAGWQLTSIGGFAEAFISRGAGIFVGSLWSVGDEPARTFSEAFYKALVEQKKTLSEATSIAREAARAAGDATWMAYVVYGYPYATVTRE